MANNPYVNKVVYGNQTLIDISDSTATADKILQGYTAYGADGSKLTGTATAGGVTVTDEANATGVGAVIVSGGGGGGSGGLEYETGTLTLSSDTNTPIIEFSNTHTELPIYINISDVTETLATDNSNLYWTFMNWYTAFGTHINTTSSSYMYGRYQYSWKTSSGASAGNIDCTTTSGSSQGSLYYLVESGRFGPYCGGSSRYWRAGRTYKWIAVWKPVDPADIPLNAE